jgi:glycerophosphoryl diester phosphodiesterase
MLVIAHRGANKEALENSWNAFELAVEGGAERIELDVQLSRDGHAVVMHDDSLARTVGAPLRISQLDRVDLAKLKLVNGEPLPFLDEVVERLLPRIELNIEIKGKSTVLARVVADLVGHHARRDAVIVSCFQVEPLEWIKHHAPDVRRACLWHNSDTFTWPFFAVLAPQVFLERAGTNVLHPHVGLVTENLMDQAAAHRWTVYAWAAMAGEERDREGLWASLKTLGLHGLCTNYPRQLRTWLEEAAIDERQYEAYRRQDQH